MHHNNRKSALTAPQIQWASLLHVNSASSEEPLSLRNSAGPCHVGIMALVEISGSQRHLICIEQAVGSG